MAGLRARWKTIFSVAVLSVALFAMAELINAEGENKTAEIVKIEKLIKESVNASVSIDQLPEPYCANPKGAVPERVKQIMFDKVTAECNEIYSADSELLKRRLESYKGVVSWQDSDHFRSLGGGIKKIDNPIINLNGDRATAEADIRKYTKLIESDGRVFTPEGTAHYEFSFYKENGRWKILSEVFDKLPEN